MLKGLFISFWGVSYVQFSETVQHYDRIDKFQLGFVKHGTEYQRSCQIAFQASTVSSLIVDLVIPYNGMTAKMSNTSCWQDDVVLNRCHLLTNALWHFFHYRAKL